MQARSSRSWLEMPEEMPIACTAKRKPMPSSVGPVTMTPVKA